MLEFLISSATIAGLAGCFYAAYVIVRSGSARAHDLDHKYPQDYADHDSLFRRPSADYYI